MDAEVDQGRMNAWSRQGRWMVRLRQPGVWAYAGAVVTAGVLAAWWPTSVGVDGWPNAFWGLGILFAGMGATLAAVRVQGRRCEAGAGEARRRGDRGPVAGFDPVLWLAVCAAVVGVGPFFGPALGVLALGLLVLNVGLWRLSRQPVGRAAVLEDRLTGLANRDAIRSKIQRRLAAMRGGRGGGFAVLFLDFDRFKLVNDTLGHEAGDRVLCAIAGRLAGLFRRSDDLAALGGGSARLGGDEFVIVLEGVACARAAMVVADRVRACFDAPFDVHDRPVHLAPSIGVVVADDAEVSAAQLLRDAHLAMYAAKRDQRRSVVLFDQAMLADATERMELENDLRHAVARGELVLHYQPLVDLESGGIHGFEALIRWQHPERGLVPPDRFIGIAEDTGLIHEIGRWAFAEAAGQLAAWTDMGLGDQVLMHVNVSTKQLYDDGLPQRLAGLVQEAGVSTGRMVVEVTESSFTTDMGRTLETLDELVAAGFAIAMDDFGTGYSSLSVLHRFPISELKIDRSFVNNMSDRPDYSAVIHAIVSLAENLRIRVLAEGIESPEQLAELQALGCGLAQGYYFSRPLPAGQALSWAVGWRQRRASA